jgi:hypothetical protein
MELVKVRNLEGVCVVINVRINEDLCKEKIYSTNKAKLLFGN